MPRTKSKPTKISTKRRRFSRASAYTRYGKKALVTGNHPVPSPVRDVADWASMSCQAPPQQNPVVNTLYQFNNIQLSQFPRAIQVAQAYQMFRIKKATFRFKPTYDTFAANGGNSKLNFYYIIDKTGALLPNASLSAIKQMGAKAFQLDEEPIEVSYAPGVLDTAMLTAGGVQVQGGSQYTVSPWLSTNNNKGVAPWAASEVDHLGISWYVEQPFSTAVTTYQVDLEVQFEFKRPLWIDPPGQEGTQAEAGETLFIRVPPNTPVLSNAMSSLAIGAGESAM